MAHLDAVHEVNLPRRNVARENEGLRAKVAFDGPRVEETQLVWLDVQRAAVVVRFLQEGDGGAQGGVLTTRRVGDKEWNRSVSWDRTTHNNANTHPAAVDDPHAVLVGPVQRGHGYHVRVAEETFLTRLRDGVVLRGRHGPPGELLRGRVGGRGRTPPSAPQREQPPFS
jgi:hypothetical protein